MWSPSNRGSSPLRPEHALIAARHRADALVDELLQALTLVGFGRVEVALGIGCDAVHAIELARLAAAVAERGEFFQRFAVDDTHAFVLTVRQHHESLSGILGEHDV